jgi:hypothetical protein
MTLVWIAVGAFIGWNLPQPFWAKMAQDAVKAKWAAFKVKK